LLVAVWPTGLKAQLSRISVNRWSPTAHLLTASAQACSVLLQDGRVLVAGGSTSQGVVNSAEVYNQSGVFVAVAPMLAKRASASCTTLPDGRVLVAGGTDGTHALASGEIFDPAQNTWTGTASMNTARSGHTATLLPWGSVLIAGGDSDGSAVRTVELYLPLADRFQQLGNMSSARRDFAIAIMPNRRVLIAGGTDGSSTLGSIDIYSADDNSITAGGSLLTARRNFAAATLLDGTVLFTGGYDARGNTLASSEIYDFAAAESVAGPAMTTPRAEHQAYTLPNNGAVLLVGGTDGTNLLAGSDLYSFQSGAFARGAALNTVRTAAAQSLMRPGNMLVAGGRNGSGILAESDVYAYATVQTDKPEYHPGDVVTITGARFTPGEQVSVIVTTLPAGDHDPEFKALATADSAGQVATTGFNIDRTHLGRKFIVTATGSPSVAQQTFTAAMSDVTCVTSVTSSSNGLPYGTPVHFNVSVTDGPCGTPGTNSPDGSVTITVDGSSIGTFPLTPGNPTSTLQTPDFTSILPGTGNGSHSVVANYLGSATPPGFSPSDTSASPYTYTVTRIAPTFSMTVNPPANAVAYQQLGFTITATNLVQGQIPTGVMNLTIDSNPSSVPAVALNNGTAMFTLPGGSGPLTAGAHNFGWGLTDASDPVYGKNITGRHDDTAVSGYIVLPANTTTVVSTSSNGQGTILTATVTPAAPSVTGPALAGKVSFFTDALLTNPYMVNGVPQTALTGSMVNGSLVVSTSPNPVSLAGGTFYAQFNGNNADMNYATSSGQLSVVSAPSMVEAFGSTVMAVASSVSLTFTITAPPNLVPLTGIAFADTLPAGLVVATPPSVSGTCTGVVTAVAGTGSVSLSGATLAGGASCTVVLNVTATSAGVKTNTIPQPSVTSANGGGSTSATTASVSVITLITVVPATISEAFAAASITQNASTTLTFTITNPPANPFPLIGLAFTSALPAGIAVTTPNGLTGTCGGTVTAVAGSGSVALSGGSLVVGAFCAITVNVTGTAPGNYTTTTTPISSVNAGTGNSASASLTVTALPVPGPKNFQQVGVFRALVSGLGVFALDVNETYNFAANDKFRFFGLNGDKPVAGDWFGTGVVALGVFRCPTAGVCQWYIDANNNGQWDGVAGGDMIWNFGLPGDLPIVGDWKGDGISRIGVMRCPAVSQSGVCTWYLDAGNKHTYDPATVVINQYGLPGDQPVANNWLGTGTVDQIGVMRCPAVGQPGTCTWFVNSTGTGTVNSSDASYSYGLPGDNPIVGNWFGTTGKKRIGVFRSGQVILNVSGSNSFVAGSDFMGSFGLPGDLPVIGLWTLP